MINDLFSDTHVNKCFFFRFECLVLIKLTNGGDQLVAFLIRCFEDSWCAQQIQSLMPYVFEVKSNFWNLNAIEESTSKFLFYEKNHFLFIMKLKLEFYWKFND